MADDDSTDTPPVKDEETQPPAPPKADVPPEVSAALKKANKEAETLRLKLKEIEDRDKSEAEKLAERAATAERRVAEVEAKALRSEIALKKGLTPSQAKRLVGSTEDELMADADDLLADIKGSASTPPPPPDVDQGVIGDGKGDVDKSVEDYVAEFNQP